MPDKDGSQMVVEATVESIREEWSNAMMDCWLYGGMHEIEGRAKEAQEAKSGIFVFIQFGVRAGLICPNEGNDWLDCLKGQKKLPEIYEKWYPEKK